MARYFLGPIKHPTWKDFFVRVGGAAALFLVAILGAKAFFPGHESTAAVFVSIGIVLVATIQHMRHAANNKKSKRRKPRR